MKRSDPVDRTSNSIPSLHRTLIAGSAEVFPSNTRIRSALFRQLQISTILVRFRVDVWELHMEEFQETENLVRFPGRAAACRDWFIQQLKSIIN